MESLLLATEAAQDAAEAAEAAGGDNQIVLVILVAGLVAFGLAWFIVGPGRGKKGAKRVGDVPLAMRPYHSDEELETVGLERAMAWGVALSLFAGVFLAVYWMIEPARVNAQRDAYYRQDTTAGALAFVDNCATCHGNNAQGGSAPNPYGEAPWPAPPLDNVAARYADSEIVDDVEQFLTQTIKQGRPGTPMPAWGSAYEGPMNDFQIDQIVTYLLSIQTDEVTQVDAAALADQSGEQLFANNCARCHGDDLGGQVGPALDTIYQRYGADLDDPSTFDPVRETIMETMVNGRRVPQVGVMPPFADDLPEDAMQRIVDHIESQQDPNGLPYGQVGGPPGATATPTASETASATEDE